MRHTCSRIFIAVVLLAGGTAYSRVTPGAGISSEFGAGFHAGLLGSGGSGTGLFGSASAALSNPALFSTLEFQEVSLSVRSLTNQAYLGNAYWALPISQSQGFGVSVSGISSGNIDRVQDYAPGGKFSYSSTLATVSYSRRLGPPVYLGVALKVLNQSLDEFSDYGIGFDLGFAARAHRYLTFGATAANILEPEIRLNDHGEKQKRSYSFGLAVPSVPILPHLWLTASGSGEWFDGYSGRYSGGLSANIDSMLVLRGGYQIDKFAFGLGLHRGRMSIDYAYQIVDVIGDQQSISITFAIGPSLQERLAQREAERKAAIDEAERRRRYEQNRLTGRDFAEKFELDSALIYYQRALAFDESNRELVGTISAVQDAIASKRATELKLAATEAETRQSIRSYYDQANQLYEKGSYRAALELLTLLTDIQPDNAQALDLGTSIRAALDSSVYRDLAEGDSALASARNVDAISAYNRVLELDTNNTRARSGKATAIARLDKAVQLNLAIEAFNRSAFEDAERRFRVVLEASPGGDATASDYLARIAVLKKRPVGEGIIPSAPVTLDQLQQDRDTWGLYLDGLRLMRNRQYDQAIKLWEQVLSAYPNQINTIENIKQARLRRESDSAQSK